MIRPSASRGRAPVSCPCCPVSLESEGVATLGHGKDERGSYATLEAFSCEFLHTLADLSLAQEAAMIESASAWLHSALDAMESARWDLRMDAARDGY